MDAKWLWVFVFGIIVNALPLSAKSESIGIFHKAQIKICEHLCSWVFLNGDRIILGY